MQTNQRIKCREKNPLIRMISDSQWEKAKNNIQQIGNENVRKWSVAICLGGNIDSTEILPIHEACTKSDVPLHFLKLLVNTYPDSLKQRDSIYLRTPLHLAIRSRTSEDVLNFLLESCPGSVAIQDSYGRVPLHYTCSNHSSITVVKKMIDICPKTICATDKCFWTPLHVASRHGLSVDVIDTMLGRCPEAITMFNKMGNFPVDLAKMNDSIARDLIFARLIQEEQEVCKMPNISNIRKVANLYDVTNSFRSWNSDNIIV